MDVDDTTAQITLRVQSTQTRTLSAVRHPSTAHP